VAQRALHCRSDDLGLTMRRLYTTPSQIGAQRGEFAKTIGPMDTLRDELCDAARGEFFQVHLRE
jgi:hypothetical protein